MALSELNEGQSTLTSTFLFEPPALRSIVSHLPLASKQLPNVLQRPKHRLLKRRVTKIKSKKRADSDLVTKEATSTSLSLASFTLLSDIQSFALDTQQTPLICDLFESVESEGEGPESPPSKPYKP